MASGDTLLVITPAHFILPTSDPAQFASRNGHLVLGFDDTTTESAIVTAILPRHYAGGGITVYVHWAAVAIEGYVHWRVSLERIGDSQQDIDADGFATASTPDNITVPGTTGHVEITAITRSHGAEMDNVAVGETFRIKVERVISDNAVGDAQLVSIEIKET